MNDVLKFFEILVFLLSLVLFIFCLNNALLKKSLPSIVALGLGTSFPFRI